MAFEQRCQNHSLVTNWRVSFNARSKRPKCSSESALTRSTRRWTARSAFAGFVQFGQECRDAVHVQALVAPECFAFAVQHDKSWESFDLILRRQFFILFSCFNALCFAAREINLH